ncbi:MAG: ATP-binding protein [Candidatus Xenobium sp.]|jgi:hypothetical protein
MSSLPIFFEAGETLKSLIHQFTDPYAFLRELIQNSLDAGSSRVDVRTGFLEDEGIGQGTAVFSVEDTGEGMDQEILDTQLTRLFSSSKEGDLTKIGKFGIGFVSVFAMEPDLVVVDTGRDGQNWRVIFHPDHHFERISLDMPVDGTTVRVYKPATFEEFQKMRRRGLETVTYWCKHCEADILYDGTRINQPFELAVPNSMTWSVPGTEMVLAPAFETAPFFGFYNRGLTLSEGHQEIIPGIQFKLNSRYLEHTLTRDQVLHDENYEKAMALLRTAVDGPLRDELFAEAGVSAPDELMGALVPRLPGLAKNWETKPIFPTLHGPPLSICELRSAAWNLEEILWDDTPSPASEELAFRAGPILCWKGPDAAPGWGALIASLTGQTKRVRVSTTWILPRLVADLSEAGKALLKGVGHRLNQAGALCRRVVAARFRNRPAQSRDPFFLIQDDPGTMFQVQAGETRPELTRTPGTLVLNLDHPLLRRHFELAERNPDLAAWLLARLLMMEDDWGPLGEVRLVEAALSDC